VARRRRHRPDGIDHPQLNNGRPFLAADLVVVDDLPRPVPVTSGELEVIETYLGALLDTLENPD